MLWKKGLIIPGFCMGTMIKKRFYSSTKGQETGSRNSHHERSLPGLYYCFWKPILWMKAALTPMLPGGILNSFYIEKVGALSLGWISLLQFFFGSDTTMKRCVAFVCLPQWSQFLDQTAAYCICILTISHQLD